MRRYNEFEQLVTKDAASGLLRDPWTQLWLAEVNDPVAAQSLLEQVPLDFSPIQVIWESRFKAALYLRDYDAADRVIAAIPAKFADRWRDAGCGCAVAVNQTTPHSWTGIPVCAKASSVIKQAEKNFLLKSLGSLF